MKTVITIVNSKQVREQFNIYSRFDIKQSNILQQALSDNHSITNNSRTIQCGCKDFKTVLYLSNKLINSKYYLSLFPKSLEHEYTCPFNNNIVDLSENKKGEMCFNPVIFKEVIPSLNTKEKYDINVDKIKSNTFTLFCLEAISKSTLSLFKVIKQDSFTNKKHFFSIFCDIYVKELKNIKINGINNIFDLKNKQKGFYFTFGIIEEDFDFNNIANLNDEDIIQIPCKSIYHNRTTNKYEVSESKFYNITKKRLLLSYAHVKIFNNYIKAPYFFNISLFYGEIVRMHLYPIYFDLNKNVINFVESNYEREYAKKITERNRLFLKPIKDYELNLLEGNKYPDLRFRPDFIEFTKDKINIIEVSGFDTLNEYKNLMKEKHDFYSSLVGVNNDISFEIIEGKNINNHLPSWTGDEIVLYGKNKDTVWNTISKIMLNWYISNTVGYFYECAFLELQRRKQLNI